MRLKSLIDFRRMIGNVQSLCCFQTFSLPLSLGILVVFTRDLRDHSIWPITSTNSNLDFENWRGHFCVILLLFFLWSCLELFLSFLPKNCISLGVIRPALEEIKPWAGYLQYRDHQHFLLASMSMGYQRITTYLNKTTTTKNFSTSLFCLNWVS